MPTWTGPSFTPGDAAPNIAPKKPRVPSDFAELLVWFEGFLIADRRKATSTVQIYLSALRSAFRLFLHENVLAVSDEQVQAALRHYQRTRSRTRAAQLHAAYERLLDWVHSYFTIRMPE